jgi:hypothetical protein
MKPSFQWALGAALLFLAQGACGSNTEPVEPVAQEELGAATAAASGTYDLANYVIPRCDGPRAYTTSGTGLRRFVPMGVNASGQGRYVYVTSADGSNFLEFTIGARWIRLVTDSSWAHDNLPDKLSCGNPPTAYCDEVCGPIGVPTSECRCLWWHGAGSADYVVNSPRDAANLNEGARFLPRTVTLSGETETQVALGSSVTRAQRKSNCTECESWHSSPPGTSQASTIAIKHMASYNGYTDVLSVRTVSGPGMGEKFYYARGWGWVGYENASGSYTDWITSTSSLTPGPKLACKNFVRSSICSALGTGGGGTISSEVLDVRYPMASGLWITQCMPNLSGRYVWQTTASGKDAYSRWANFMWPEQITTGCGTMNNGLYPLVFTSLPAGGYRGTWVTQCLPSGKAQHVYRIDTDVNSHPAAVYLYDEPNAACP